jgi:phytoene dehydrogenase-like protein
MKKVVIIGSGIGGLTCGNLLAKKGHKVIIFESYSTPGGYTAGFRRKGYYFESGTLSFEASSLVFRAMRQIGVHDRIRFVRQPTRWVTGKFDLDLDSLQGLKKAVFGAFPSERPSLERFFREVEGMYRAMKPFVGRAAPSPLAVPAMLPGMIRLMSLYRRYSSITLGEFAARFFDRESGQGAELYRLFTSLGYPDMAAFALGGLMATLFHDYWTVRDGMQAWADVLTDNFEELGGVLRLRSRVDRIVTENGAAVGVASGGTFEKADAVVAAGDYKKTFLSLLDNRSLVPQGLIEKIESAPVSEGVFTVYLGLSVPNEGLRERLRLPHVLLSDDKPGAENRDPGDRDFFDKTSVTLYSPSLVNPSHAPRSKSSLMVQAVCPVRWMNDWESGDRKKYLRLKEMVMKALIRKASTLIPNLHRLIEVEDAATPLTYERYTGNTGGATSAWSWNPKNRFYENSMTTRVETPVRNLYIGSCWASQIGGVPGAIGAARRCANRIG